MLMMHAPRAKSGEYQATNWAPEDLAAHIAFMHALNKDLTAAGELVSALGLATPGEARIVRVENGVPAVTDGPYPETKEFLAGFWLVDVDKTERAYEIAARASAAPGPGGKPLGIALEVRQVMIAPSMEA
jgi:hypothetical protein